MMLGMNLTTRDTKVHEGNLWFHGISGTIQPAGRVRNVERDIVGFPCLQRVKICCVC